MTDRDELINKIRKNYKYESTVVEHDDLNDTTWKRYVVYTYNGVAFYDDYFKSESDMNYHNTLMSVLHEMEIDELKKIVGKE